MAALLLSTASLVALVNAVAFPGPVPTSLSEDGSALGQGWSPRPTPLSQAEIYRDLLKNRKRAAASGGVSQIGLYAPDNTCGYLGGSLGASKTCDATETCVAVTAGTEGVAGCCVNRDDCTFVTDCVNSSQYFFGTICGDVCQHDNLVLKCTNPAAPMCYGYSFTDIGASFYSCATVQATALGLIETTFAGETDGRTWSPLLEADSSSSTKSSSSSAPSPSSSTTPLPTPTPIPSPIPSPTPSSSGKPTPVGAIAGGVVGGVAVLGAIICAIVFMCLRNKRKQRGDNSGAYEPPMDQAEAAPKPPVAPQSPPAPVTYAPYVPPGPDKSGFQTQSQYMPPSQQYQYQNPPVHPDYASQAPEAFSPPHSPAPQYSANDRPHSTLEAHEPVVSPNLGPPPTAAQLDAPTHIPSVGRDGRAVYEVGT